MNRQGPIVIVEDDLDDQELILDTLKNLGVPNEVVFFNDGKGALDYLSQPHVAPFLLISDINMPVVDGFQLNTFISENREMKYKCIPFIFLTTANNPRLVKKAYEHSIQGFFTKPDSINEWKAMFQRIMDYWKTAKAPLRA